MMPFRTESLASAAIVLASVVLVTGAQADSTTITPAADTTLYADDGSLSNGSGTSFITGVNAVGQIRRALLRFDVASALPAGSIVESATLTLRLAQTQAQATDVAVHALTQAWGESDSNADAFPGQGANAATGDATWTHRFHDTQTWTSAGGDFVATVSAIASVAQSGEIYSWTSPMLAADVQGWLDEPAGNHGWILLGDESTSVTAKRFFSREVVAEEFRPVLEIVFTPPTAQGACCADDGSCSVVSDPGTSCEGAYVGAGTGCEPNPCAQTSGACCLPVAAATCVEVTAAECAAQTGSFAGPSSECDATTCPVVLEPFVDPLPRPAVATPLSGIPGATASYRLAARQITQQLHRDLPATTVWGYGDDASGATYPGPSIEAAVGQPVTVTWLNDLRDELGALRTDHYLPVDSCLHGAHHPDARIVTHLHGGHVPAEYDGHPDATLLPAEEATYVYPNDQLAATLWYHDHALGITRLNVYMGLAGFYLLRDAAESALALPSGDFEVPIVIQDRTFRADGSLVYPDQWTEHFFGDTILANGKVWPYLEVDRGKYRFRLLNGSNSRTYTLALSDGSPLLQIGTDGGLLAAPVPVDAVTLAPGERADVVVDFASYPAGTELVLENSAPAPFARGIRGTTSSPMEGHADGGVAQVVKFIVGAADGHTGAIPATLADLDDPDEGGAVVVRDFELKKESDDCTGATWLINGLRWDDITEFPRLGNAEIWRFVNRSGIMHPMHIHLTMFRILDRQRFTEVGGEIVPDGAPTPPAPEESGWKDTVRVDAREIVRVIARFETYKGRFAYHCHILEHEDHEMMRQFETVDCGDGVLDPGEDCDEGSENGSETACCTVDCEVVPGCGTACGDANDDGTITATDALIALNTAVGLGACPIEVCDVNASGSVTATDALTILNAAVGIPVDLQCPG